MLKASQAWCVGLLTITTLLIARVEISSAQENTKEVPKPRVRYIELDPKNAISSAEALAALLLKEKEKKSMPKHDGSELNQSLREVINTGVKMFNDQGDYAGCYRLYQGSLISVRPFLAPDLQKKIDKGIANAETMRNYADRAYELRRVLDEIRASLPGGPSSVTGDKGQITGRLSYEGKAVKGGYFVTLVGADGKKFSSAIQKDGSFQFKTPIAPGKYRVAIEPIPGETVKGAALPARFSSEESSGIVIVLDSGKSAVDLNLVK